eukprot:Seg2731.5 transcript_id=Seg2731.5/GoldUCD/mRNA.D3Y31 product="Calcium and integrin-binding family member 2" protein_id=Seg2731.5/GoldUCD/D3Y31
MGCSTSKFSPDELREYSELTFLSPSDIVRCYNAFQSLDPEKVDADRNVILPMRTVLALPALKANPFRDRICEIFSSNNNGMLSFEDFLDMMSTFSENAPKSVKIEYAFRIYDFNEDDFICKKDLATAIRRLSGLKRGQNVEMIAAIIEKVMKEADLDDDGKLSFNEFEHVMSNDADFLRTFRIQC